MLMDDRTIINDIQNGSTQSSLACKLCRRKKLKCDRTVPECRNCLKTSRQCEYPAVAQKPGPRPGTHRRAHYPSRARQSDSAHTTPTSVLASSDTQPDPEAGAGAGAGDARPLDSGDSAQSTQAVASPSGSPFSVACRAMSMSEQACLEMIDLYFKNMTAFSLFHQPTFLTKLANIDSAKHIQALLTSMLAFCRRYTHSGGNQNAETAAVLERAHVLNQDSLRECAEDAPPLHLLQSFLIATHLTTTNGVRGKAWRLVGQCVRMAYELRLHEIDQELPEIGPLGGPLVQPVAECWVAVEEKRRAWWATWECDIFSSSMRRLPTSVDWNRIRTNLPSSDEAWFAGRTVPSCWLHVDPSKRWKDMRDCGNTSPHAWFILLDSYKWDALATTLRTSAPTTLCNEDDNLKGYYDAANYKPMSVRRREVIENCVRCALGAVPESLQFHGGYLAFEPSKDRNPSHRLIRDHGTYVMDIIIQVAQILLCRTDVRGSEYICFLGDLVREQVPSSLGATDVSDSGASKRRRWQMCLIAADRIAHIVRNAAPHHHRFSNPNIATALWMAAATETIALTLYRDEIDVDLAQSNLDLLAATMDNFVKFWNGPKALTQSLPALKRQLQIMNKRSETSTRGSTSGSTMPSSKGGDYPHTEIDLLCPLNNGTTGQTANAQPTPDTLQNLGVGADPSLDLNPIDVLQLMDFSAVYNGADDWEAMLFDPFVPQNGVGI